MTFEEYEKATPQKLREEAKSCFDTAVDSPSWGGAPTLVLQAQFYMMEMDRRHAAILEARDAGVARRDFRMEWVVIILIGLELLAATWGIVLGKQQGRDDEKLMRDQTGVLQELQRSTAATAATLAALQGTMEKMNQAVQTQLEQADQVLLEGVIDVSDLILTNKGRPRL